VRKYLSLVLVAAALGLVVPAHAEEDWTAQRPSGDAPTEISVSMYVVDVFAINSAEQSVEADVIYLIRWQDPRLAESGAGSRRMALSQVWNPAIQSLNTRSAGTSFPEVVIIEEDGLVTYRQRLVGSFSLSMNLTEFPFDEHLVTFRFFSLANRADEVTFIEGEVVGQAAELSITDWQFGTGSLSVEPLIISPAIPPVPGFGYSVRISRHKSFYAWKVILPLVVIVFMSWAAFWIHPSQVKPQVGIAATSILTVIAYRFALGHELPKVSYTTRMDLFMNGAFVLVFLALVEVVWATHLFSREDTRLGQRLNRYSRALFPVAFAAIMVYAFWL